MYCKKCGKQLESDAVFCSSCGTKTNNATEDEALVLEQTLGDYKEQTDVLNEENTSNLNVNAKKKPKVKIIVSCIITLSIILSIIIPITIKNSRVTEIPNYYFDFGSQSISHPVGSPENKSFSVDVTLVSSVKAYDLAIEVYVYSGNKFITKFVSKTQTTLRGRNTTAITIDFPDKSLLDRSKYNYCFTATAKTHDKLPSIEYGIVTFLNYDNSVYETVIVEKRAGDTPIYPIPERNGYTFAGWYYDSSFKQEFYMSQQHVYREQYEDVVLYSKWIKN